jgi:ankyrin repeat protein
MEPPNPKLYQHLEHIITSNTVPKFNTFVGAHKQYVQQLFSAPEPYKNKSDHTLLHRALINKNIAMLNKVLDLIRATGNMDIWLNHNHSCNLIAHLCYSDKITDHVAKFNLLRENGLSLDHLDSPFYTWPPLYHAASNNYKDMVILLVNLGSKSINEIGLYGRTVMHFLAELGHSEMIELLVQLGCQSLDVLDSTGISPLYEAIKHENIHTAITILRLGSCVLRNKNIYTPVFSDKCTNSEYLTELLVRQGANLDWVDPNTKKTELHHAVHFSHPLVVITICMFRPSLLDKLDEKGCTPGMMKRWWNMDSEMECYKMIKALGYSVRKDVELDEDYVVETRYKVYFSLSLSYRLLLETEGTFELPSRED